MQLSVFGFVKFEVFFFFFILRHLFISVSFPRSFRFSQGWLGILWIGDTIVYVEWSQCVCLNIISSFILNSPTCSLCQHLLSHVDTYCICSERWWEKGSKLEKKKKGNKRTVEVCLPWESKIKKKAIACDVSHEKGLQPFRLLSSWSYTFN